jgi:hypothetical protein
VVNDEVAIEKCFEELTSAILEATTNQILLDNLPDGITSHQQQQIPV